MNRRSHPGGRRAEAAEETRRRIVEATFALHEEQGIAATSMKQIAARAGVSVGSVYHHFPTYEDAINACGKHTIETFPPPGPEGFAGLRSVEARVTRMLQDLFDYFARLPVLERVRCDQHLMPALRAFVAAEEATRRALIGQAFATPLTPRQLDLAAAITDPAVQRALARAGWSNDAAAASVARTLLAAVRQAAP